MPIKIKMADITQQKTDVLINSANAGLVGGGGVDGAIHRAAGPELADHIRKYWPECEGSRMPAVYRENKSSGYIITPNFDLPCKFIAHFALYGPYNPEYKVSYRMNIPDIFSQMIWELRSSYGAKTIAVPAIGCGIYGYPKKLIAEILFHDKVRDALGDAEMTVCLVGDPELHSVFGEKLRIG